MSRPARSLCPHCKGSHTLFGCQQFRDINLDRRWNIVTSTDVCRNCLTRGHQAAQCASRFSCRHCKQRHNTLLHKPSKDVSASESETTPSARQQDTAASPVSTESPPGSAMCASTETETAAHSAEIPRTVQALVVAGCRQRKVRALLDSGSTLTLITTKLANDLQARLRRCETSISGYGGSGVSRFIATITIAPPDLITTEHHTFEAHVVDRICEDLPPINTTNLKQDQFLKDLHLADPLMGSPGRIDLLLRLSDCNSISKGGFHVSEDKKLSALHTIFGWSVGGTVKTPEAGAIESCLKISMDQSLDEAIQKLWEVEAVPGEGSATPEEAQALQHFTDTVRRKPDGRYSIQLPRRSDPPHWVTPDMLPNNAWHKTRGP